MSIAGPNATADKTTVAADHVEQTQTHCACHATELHKPETYLKLESQFSPGQIEWEMGPLRAVLLPPT